MNFYSLFSQPSTTHLWLGVYFIYVSSLSKTSANFNFEYILLLPLFLFLSLLTIKNFYSLYASDGLEKSSACLLVDFMPFHRPFFVVVVENSCCLANIKSLLLTFPSPQEDLN